jgi:hypothetical protein
VWEGDLVCVEVVACVAWEGEAFAWFDCAWATAKGVEGVVYEGITCGGQVNANLVGAACDDVYVNE